MPFVFAENEATESGIKYQDRTGIQYQYPRRRYTNLIHRGDRFIYYRGRKAKNGSRVTQIYFGTGIVGDIQPDPNDTNRMLCNILDYKPFEKLVPFKFGRSDYLEHGGSRKGYFQPGMRRISEEEFDRIISLGFPEGLTPENRGHPMDRASALPDSETARRVEEFAVQKALAFLRSRFPGDHIKEMCRNNPGFDILLSLSGSEHYVEVKGTQSSVARFFMSNGELIFSRANSGCYFLLIVYNIDLAGDSHQVILHKGPIEGPVFEMLPMSWKINYLINQ